MTDLDPMSHQIAFVQRYEQIRRHGVWWDPGTGKTIAELLGVRHYPDPTLVIAPKVLTESAWIADATEYFDDLTVDLLAGTPTQRRRILRTLIDGPLPDVVVTNYELVRQATTASLLGECGFRRLILDESGRVKNPESKSFEYVARLARTMSTVHALNGTPEGNKGKGDYWGQLACIDASPEGPAGIPGASGPTQPINFWRWANHWCYPVKRTVVKKVKTPRGWVVKEIEVIDRWELKPSRATAFHEMLSRVSWRLELDDCVDMPGERTVPVYVTLSKREMDAYRMAERRMLAGEKLSERAVANKLRQLTGGFAYLPGPDGAPKQAMNYGDSKIKALIENMEGLPPDEKSVVWGEFRHENTRIADAMRKLGRTVEIIDGRTRRAPDVIERFQKEPHPEVLVCNPQSVGHGVTLTRARYDHTMTDTWDHVIAEQRRRRIYRTGQRKKVVHYRYVVRDSIDEAVYGVQKRVGGTAGGTLSILKRGESR